MANLKEILDRTRSIQDTMKITGAMYMISSSKLKRARQTLTDTEPYFYGLQDTVGRILRHTPELRSPFFDERPQKKSSERSIGHIVITADKGMAGAYNHNILKTSQELLDRCMEDSDYLFVVGECGRQYFERNGHTIDGAFHYTVQKPTMHRARVIAEHMIGMYLGGQIDEVYLVFTKQVSSTVLEPEVLRLLPQKRVDFAQSRQQITGVFSENVEFYPSAKEVFNNLIPNYITGIIYSALVESYCCEQNARMTAMQAATDSAKEMLKDLSLTYQRLRQAAITQEITEVASGARAVLKAQKRKKQKKQERRYVS